MPTDVYITNGNINKWFDDQNSDRADLQAQTLLWTILYAAQLLIYYNLWKDITDKRDAVIEDLQSVLDYLQITDLGVDYPQMLKKQNILELHFPEKKMCADSKLFEPQSKNDADVVDDMASYFMRQTCKRWPNDHNCDPLETSEGALCASVAQDYTGTMLANSSKRRREKFRQNKTQLALRAQATARMAVAPILQMYQQAIQIYEGLASVFMQGFTSAGAGLGINLWRLGSSGNNNGSW